MLPTMRWRIISAVITVVILLLLAVILTSQHAGSSLPRSFVEASGIVALLAMIGSLIFSITDREVISVGQSRSIRKDLVWLAVLIIVLLPTLIFLFSDGILPTISNSGLSVITLTCPPNLGPS